MASTFPTALDTIPDAPTTEKLGESAPTHPQMHDMLRDAIAALEATIGITGSTNPASITKRVVDLEGKTAKTLWASGQIFWIPPGDGGANGMLFAGGGTGAFTLSAAVPVGFSVPQLWIYLTANAGGSGNPAGWHYATMSSDVSGIVYADCYDSTSGAVPVFPASPTTLNCTSATRLTTTLADTQMFQVPVSFAAQMGLNGLLEMAFKTFGNNAAGSKYVSLRAGANLLYQMIPTTNPVMDGGVAVSSCGSMAKQLVTRQSNSQYASPVGSVSNDFRSVNLDAETTLNVGIKLTATTDSFAVAVRKLSMIYGG